MERIWAKWVLLGLDTNRPNKSPKRKSTWEVKSNCGDTDSYKKQNASSQRKKKKKSISRVKRFFIYSVSWICGNTNEEEDEHEEEQVTLIETLDFFLFRRGVMSELEISPAIHDPQGQEKQQQAAGVGILLQIMMLVLSFVLGHVLRRHKFYYLPEASASLLIGLFFSVFLLVCIAIVLSFCLIPCEIVKIRVDRWWFSEHLEYGD